jgi:dTDP-glucose pyrophosphorylase
MTTAVVMAGGRSARMRASAGPRHKALVPVLGVPMLERNLCALLSQGFREIVVAISAQDEEIGRYVDGRARALARARRARVACLREPVPLGTIGAVAALPATGGSVLVVNVDNLTALALRTLVAFHEAHAAALTIASHVERVQVPCGELAIAGDRVTAYREKPLMPVTASSGTYVVGPPARAVMGSNGRWDVPALASALIARGATVCALRHDAPWIDVNDAAAIARAERLITEHREAFEHWDERPAAEVAALLPVSPARVWLVARDEGWDLAVERVVADDATPAAAIDRLLAARPGWTDAKAELLTSFDELDLTTAALVRYHVYVARVAEDAWPPPGDRTARWVERDGIGDAEAASPALRRALAYADAAR